MYQVCEYLHKEKSLTINVSMFADFDKAVNHADAVELKAKDAVQVERCQDGLILYERNRIRSNQCHNGKYTAIRKFQFVSVFCGLDGGYYFPQIGLGIGK